jgi:hypothetical protein
MATIVTNPTNIKKLRALKGMKKDPTLPNIIHSEWWRLCAKLSLVARSDAKGSDHDFRG